MSLLVLYKNAARVGYFTEIRIHAVNNNEDSVPTEDDVFGLEAKGAIRKIQLLQCDDEGRPGEQVPRQTAPEIFFRSDRGPWSVFGDKTSVYVNDGDSIQICTRENSNIFKKPMRLSFGGDFMSEMFMVMSKPPSKISAPFARFEAQTKVLDSLKQEPIICKPCEKPIAWKLQTYGSHRPSKRPRVEEVSTTEELEQKLAAANKTIAGLQTALRLLSH
jgi:hypothetical protein